MKANLTYSRISANLKPGMFILVNDKLGFVAKITKDEASIAYYYENNKMVAVDRKTMSTEELVKNYKDNVVKLIAIVDGNPISINHHNYKKIFSNMLTFPRGGSESFITTFLRTNEWKTPLIGEIVPVYSMLFPDTIATIISLDVVDKLGLYDVEKRLAKVISKKPGSKYEIALVHDESIKTIVHRLDLRKDENDKYDLFNTMDWNDLKDLVNSGEAKAVELKSKALKDTTTSNANVFHKLLKSDWKASFDTDRKWVAVNEKTQEKFPISIPIVNVPKYQFSGMDNDYWIPGTVKEQKDPSANLKNFVPFREGLPVFGEVVTQTIGDTKFTYFLLDNIKQESVNRFIYKHRDLTEERRSQLTIKKLPTL